MNRRQISQLAMVQAVVGFLDQHAPVWNAYPIMLPVINDVRNIVGELVKQSQKQEENSTPGFTRTKDNEMEKLVDATVRLSAQLRAFGKVKRDEVLLESVRHSRSTYDTMPAQAFLQNAQIIINHAKTKLPELVDYGVTEANVVTLEAIHTQIAKLVNIRDTARGTGKSATDTIPELLTELRDKLDLLDDLVESLIEDEEFEKVYYNMRKIVDRGGRSNKPEETN